MNSATLTVNNQRVPYKIRKHPQARSVKLSISASGLTLTLPPYVPSWIGKRFLNSKIDWIAQHLPRLTKPSLTKTKKTELRIQTRNLVRSRLQHFNQYYHLSYSRITIRDQSTRWGSCSSNRTLSFNLRLALLDSDLSDYIVVHELCHLKHMNHSRSFWLEVAKTIPDYRSRRRRLKQLHL